MPAVLTSDESAAAAVNSSRSTKRGNRASSEGRCKASSPAIAAATA